MNETWGAAVDPIRELLVPDLGDPVVLFLIGCVVFGLTVNAAKARWRRRG